MADTATAAPPVATVLLVDDDERARRVLAGFLSGEGYEVIEAASTARAMDLLRRRAVELVVTESATPACQGGALLRFARQQCPQAVTVFTSSAGAIDAAVEALRQGACEYLAKPLVDDELRMALSRALQQHRLLAENARLRQAADRAAGLEGVVTRDRQMLGVLDLVEAVADARSTVLITGESGTGKSLIARALHRRGRRRDGPFVAVACGALPETLLESELFGHVRGAFTDAVSDKPGKFTLAEGGTIFLDEIATASPALQVKLLRVLQERAFEPVGGTRTLQADVRVILATNRDLLAEVEAGRFRRDLYYRVNVVNIDLPPLRQRPGDILPLAEHFLSRYGREMGKAVAGLSEEAQRLLCRYGWPGNIRELENCIERAVLLARGHRIEAADLPAWVRNGARDAEAVEAAGGSLRQRLAGAERRILAETLERHGQCRKAAAAELGINRITLYRKMRQHGLLGGGAAAGAKTTGNGGPLPAMP